MNQNTRALLDSRNRAGADRIGVAGALANPPLKIFQGTQLVAENDNWSAASNATASASQSIGAFRLGNGGQDAAILVTLPPNAYAIQVSGVNNSTGVALVEIYEIP